MARIGLGPSEPPLLASFRAAAILSGQYDKELKDQEAKPELVNHEASSSKETLSDSKQHEQGQQDSSPLSRVLRLRLRHAKGLLNAIDRSQSNSKHDTIAEDDIHALTAEAALLCLTQIKRHLELSSAQASFNLESIGSKDRKSIRTLLSLASQWGFGPALLTYDATFNEVVKPSNSHGPRLEEVDAQEVRQNRNRTQFAHASHRLGTIFASAVSLLGQPESVSGSPSLQFTPFDLELILTPQQPIASQILGTAIRLALGPSFPSSQPLAADKGKHQETQHVSLAKSLLPPLMKTLPPSTLLPLLSSISSSSTSPDSPPLPPFVRQFTTRVLSAQLLRPEGISILISTTMGLDSAASSGPTEMSGIRKLDRIATLLITPPPGMPQRQMLENHTLPTLIESLLGASSKPQSAAAKEAFAQVATYTFLRLFSDYKELLSQRLGPFLWEPLQRIKTSNPSQPNKSQESIIATSSEITETIGNLELLVLYIPSHASDYLKWVVEPVLDILWEMMPLLDNPGKASIAELPADKTRTERRKELQTQVASIVHSWFTAADANKVTSFLKNQLLVSRKDSTFDNSPRKLFKLQDDGLPALVLGTPSNNADSAIDAEQLLSRLSPQVKLSGNEEQKEDEALKESMRLLSALGGDSQSSASRLASEALLRSNRFDVASLLLPELLERYLALKTQSNDATAADSTTEMFSLLQMIVDLIETFGEEIVKRDPEQAVRFVNICLPGVQGDDQNHQDEMVSSLPTTPRSGTGKGAMNDLLNVGQPPGSREDGGEDALEEVDEEMAKLAVDLLLSALESNSSMSQRTNPLLVVIERKLASARLTSHPDEDLRRVVKEAQLALSARRELIDRESSSKEEMTTIDTPDSKARKSVHADYDEALKHLQDPILPVRAHGLVLLKDLAQQVHSQTKSVDVFIQARIKAIQQILPSVFDLLLQAIGDEESYLYMNAIQALKEVILCGQPYMGQVIELYAGNVKLATFTREEVDKRLRLGEALLHSVQKLSEGASVYADILLPPLLFGLRQAKFPTTLRSSYLSLLGTCVEAFPSSFAHQGLSKELTETCIQILKSESVNRPSGNSHAALREEGGADRDAIQEEDEELTPEDLKRRMNFAPGADDSTGVDTTFPQLRRGALLLLNLLISGATTQLDAAFEKERNLQADQGTLRSLRLPGGNALPSISNVTQYNEENLKLEHLLFDSSCTASVRTVAGYVQQNDTDALVRHQCGEIFLAIDAFDIALVSLGMAP
ncbi:unnamed protein product [Sympodiomycopsis kandeliae]